MQYTFSDHTFAVCAYKESAFLEDCILSLLSQTVKSNIIIATSTPNEHINGIAAKFDLPVFINTGEKGIGGDWNFAYSCCKTPLITIAHQDDIYEPDYTEQMLKSINSSDNPILYFCSYGELRNGQKVYKNKLLNAKALMLSPLKFRFAQKSRFIRRRILSLGNPICCPAVTYVRPNVGENPFSNNYLSNIDWEQWEIQSRKKGSFVYEPKPLMCHRIHSESTTSEIIGESNGRTSEDYDMFARFWPKPIARLITKYYSKSQKSNSL